MAAALLKFIEPWHAIRHQTSWISQKPRGFFMNFPPELQWRSLGTWSPDYLEATPASEVGLPFPPDFPPNSVGGDGNGQYER